MYASGLVKLQRGRRRTFGDDRHVHYLDCGDSFMGAYIYIYVERIRLSAFNIWIYVNYISIQMSQL